jgi:parallel beta-helix repeat protein
MAALQGGGASFSIAGSQNLLDSNWGAGPQIGFLIGGDQNLLLENTSAPIPPDIPPAHEGFLIVGNQNLLIRNNASAADQNGFVIDGDGNRLMGNLALNSPFSGILVSGQETVIVGNTALDNSTDIEDTHEDCDNNRWQRNVFRTSQAGTTVNPACIRGQSPQAREMVQLP